MRIGIIRMLRRGFVSVWSCMFGISRLGIASRIVRILPMEFTHLSLGAPAHRITSGLLSTLTASTTVHSYSFLTLPTKHRYTKSPQPRTTALALPASNGIHSRASAKSTAVLITSPSPSIPTSQPQSQP
jgi:hypothetical protein